MVRAGDAKPNQGKGNATDMRPYLGALLLALALVPTASAWQLTPAPRVLSNPVDSTASTATTAAACVLGDVNKDTNPDLLLRAVDAAGHVRLTALAGPDFRQAVWSKVVQAGAILQCAPDLDGDGIADPVLSIASAATSSVPGAVDSSQQVLLQTLSGASGLVQVSRSVTIAATGAASSGLALASQASAQLVPVPGQALALVQSQIKGAALPALPAVPGLPLGALAATAQATASLQVLGAAGQVVGTVTVDAPGVVPLALAAVPAGGLPQVVSLTARAVSPVQQLAAQVPTLSLFNVDGTLAWAVDLSATTGIVALLPQPGDLNLDGVPDLLVSTTSTVQGVAASQVTAVSGLTGQVLFVTQAVQGAVEALPLGQLNGVTALLQASASASGGITLKALDGAGKVLWSVDVAGAARAANLAVDAATGDLVGFTDLTGDGAPDIGIATSSQGSLNITVLDGVSGQVAWTASVQGVDTVTAVAHKAAAGASSALATVAGEASDLIAVGGHGQLTVTLIQGTTGLVEWSASAATSADLVASVSAAGALTGTAQDLLITVTQASSQASSAATDATAQVYALSSTTGATIMANATATAGGLLQLLVTPGPAYSRPLASTGTDVVHAAPAAGVLVLAAVLVAAFVARRR